MKLNLLPTHVSKASGNRVWILISVLVFAVAVIGSVLLMAKGEADLTASKDEIPKLRRDAMTAKETADYADQVVIPQATTLIRNTNLAETMLKHDSAYPDLFDEVRAYIPSFYRVNSMSAVALGPGQSTVTLVGVLDTYQQYADLMLALLRMRGVEAVTRSGFQNDATYVPAPTEIDQLGKPRKRGDQPIPDDPLKRMDYFLSKGGVTGYNGGAGGFGTGAPGPKGAMPNASVVTVTITVNRDLQTPDPRSTLALASGDTKSQTTPPAGPNATGGNVPQSTPPPTTKGPKGRGKKGATDDDE